MSVKRALARLLHPIEKTVDRVKHRPADAPLIEPYLGYATPETVVLRGRILGRQRRGAPKPDQGRWANFKQMLALFATDEVADVAVATRDTVGISDEEGYFVLIIPRDDGMSGWIRVEAWLPDTPEETATLEALVPPAHAAFGIISDIDDTVLETGAYSLARNLWTSLTGNALTRRVFPDSIALIDALHGGKNPVYYVSSSPWNLFHFLRTIFDRTGLQKGPMFLRDLGLSETQFISGTHGDHKGAAIEQILNTHPDLPFVLIGDTGQHDAQVYLDAAKRHPAQVKRVILREPGPGPDTKSKDAIEKLRKLGVRVDTGQDFTQLPDLDGQRAGTWQADADTTKPSAPKRKVSAASAFR
ncbi:phosphatase domain-containing protein [uncultured Tateyamaria sp.]|uniref:App1 family protein n=1 Tax=uncultured Tateyamaria sp. TaxID=455651 RepID=UPI0026299278|nr:phosphatase domain-containing protein [uncultured Tateyamaria sp.]